MLHLLKGNYFNSCELFLFRFLMMNAWSKTLIVSLQNMREKHTINRSSALWQLWSVQNISYILWGPFTGSSRTNAFHFSPLSQTPPPPLPRVFLVNHYLKKSSNRAVWDDTSRTWQRYTALCTAPRNVAPCYEKNEEIGGHRSKDGLHGNNIWLLFMNTDLELNIYPFGKEHKLRTSFRKF